MGWGVGGSSTVSVWVFSSEGREREDIDGGGRHCFSNGFASFQNHHAVCEQFPVICTETICATTFMRKNVRSCSVKC